MLRYYKDKIRACEDAAIFLLACGVGVVVVVVVAGIIQLVGR